MASQTYTSYAHYGTDHVSSLRGYAIREQGQRDYADLLRTQSAAEHACRMLNAGACTLDRHRPLGARVQPAADRYAANEYAAAAGRIVALAAAHRTRQNRGS